jgi:hypothetical protein
MMLDAPQRLRLSNQATEVTHRTFVTGSRAIGNNRFADIRPADLATRSATSSLTGS